jgi:hypothetical protein
LSGCRVDSEKKKKTRSLHWMSLTWTTERGKQDSKVVTPDDVQSHDIGLGLEIDETPRMSSDILSSLKPSSTSRTSSN